MQNYFPREFWTDLCYVWGEGFRETSSKMIRNTRIPHFLNNFFNERKQSVVHVIVPYISKRTANNRINNKRVVLFL